MLYILAVMHMLVDAVTISTLYSAVGGHSPENILTWTLVYNFLAFSTQMITGAGADLTTAKCGTGTRLYRLLRRKSDIYLMFAITGSLIAILSAFLPMGVVVRIVLAGIGNSLFHVGGGAYALHEHKGKAYAAGVFVGPGALGVALGTLYTPRGSLLATDLLSFTVILFLIWILIGRLGRGQGRITVAIRQMLSRERLESVREPVRAEVSSGIRPGVRLMAVLFLLTAVFFRAASAYYPSSSWKTGTFAVMAAAVCIAAGKIAGGIAADRIGTAKVMFLSVFVSTPLVLLFPDSFNGGLISLFLINLAMPVTLVLVYRYMPKFPAFAFGLASSVIAPGVLIGSYSARQLSRLDSPTQKILYTGVALAILILVLISNNLIWRQNKERSNGGT
jgi:FSR family fosmidomycin resistance protein-like MFS transporter